MNTIKEIQELAKQTDDWTKSKVAENLLNEIHDWRGCRAFLDENYLELHRWLTFIVDSYPKHPDNIPQSVEDAIGIVNAMALPLDRKREYSHDAKAHAKRIYEYLDMLGIWNKDREQLWEEIAQKEDN